MTSNQQIISDLRLAMDMHQHLDLMVIYKGVPVISKAEIKDIQGDIVTMITHDPGLVCLRTSPQTSILGSDYFEPSAAKIQKVEIQSGEVVLDEFTYLGTRLGERMIIRVEPAAPIPLKLEFEDQAIDGELVDISLSGAGVRIPSEKYTPLLKPGAVIQIKFELPNGAISISGTVLSGTRNVDLYRLSVRFGQNGEQKERIFRYMVDRRAQIEQELRTEYEKAKGEA
ncbi:MAG: hypothetical protein B6D39_08180 [Anaerolineae bacterium UTCFX2]|jgi:hypothetical protein|nr:PilZ domain-containing protein [Anaerolineales bacterium]OQY90510.1 MAG: hypothetical protein B6D39_08180 [Anaerolineae bacterium UTCFX2]